MKDNFDDVDNFDDLQSKVSGIISEFSTNLESHIDDAKKAGTTKKDELLKIAQEFYANHEATLDAAKSKAASFTGIPEATIDSWLTSAHTELNAVYAKIQSKFADAVTPDVPKKAPTRKPAAKKAE